MQLMSIAGKISLCDKRIISQKRKTDMRKFGIARLVVIVALLYVIVRYALPIIINYYQTVTSVVQDGL